MKTITILLIPILLYCQPTQVSRNYAKKIELSNLDSVNIAGKKIDLKKLRDNDNNIITISQRYVGPGDIELRQKIWFDTLHHDWRFPCEDGVGCNHPENEKRGIYMPYTVYKDPYKTTKSKQDWLRRKEEVRAYFNSISQK